MQDDLIHKKELCKQLTEEANQFTSYREYIGFNEWENTVCLDGNFSSEELRKIIVMLDKLNEN